MLNHDICDGILGSIDPQMDCQDYYAIMAAPVGEMHERRRYSTGTWTFMSIDLLRSPKKAHEILDDFESLFWTMLFCGAHHFKHTGKIAMRLLIEARYDESKDMVVGGGGKLLALTSLPIKFSCKPFNRLVRALAEAIRCYHDSKFCVKRLEETRAYDSDPDEDDSDESSSLSMARKTLKENHDKLNDPNFWIQMFEEALSKNGWQDDLVEEDQYAT